MILKRPKKAAQVTLVAALVILLASLVAIFWVRGGTSSSKPNIVIITMDSLRADHMGIYGYSKKTTPFLDSLLKQGVVFENAITPSYHTWLANGSIMTSLYSSENSLYDIEVSPDYLLTLNNLPKILESYGWETYGFMSRAHLQKTLFPKFFSNFKLAKNQHNFDEFAPEIYKVLEKPSDKPKFVMWNIFDIHTTYVKPTKEFYSGDYQGVFADKDRWAWYGEPLPKNPYVYDGENLPIKDTSDLVYLNAAYDSSVRAVDDKLRAFFDQIKDKSYFRNTIFIITAEHGDDLKEHGFIWHRDLYEVNLHVPLAIIYPKKLASRRVKIPVSTVDIMPTLLSFLGIPKDEEAEGVDILETSFAKIGDRHVFSERPPLNEFSLRTSRYKYILRNPDKRKKDFFPDLKVLAFYVDMVSRDKDTGDELYDLSSDPYEQHNLVGQGLAVEGELRKEIVAFRERMRQARLRYRPLLSPTNTVFTYP